MNRSTALLCVGVAVLAVASGCGGGGGDSGDGCPGTIVNSCIDCPDNSVCPPGTVGACTGYNAPDDLLCCWCMNESDI